METTRRRVFGATISLCALLVISLCSQVQAAMVWDFSNPGPAVTIKQIKDAGGLSAGGMLFENWVVDTTSPDTQININEIKVRAFTNGDGGVGLTFIAPWVAGTNEQFTTNIEFSVTTSKKIRSVSLWASSYSTDKEGVMSIAENLTATPPTNPNVVTLGELGIFHKDGDPANKITDKIIFAQPTGKIFVSKDISVRGSFDKDAAGSAHLSKFSQYYHIPEPAALSLLGLGSLMVLARRKERS